MNANVVTGKSKSPWKNIFLTGLLAGLLDLVGACLSYFISTGKGPMNIVLFIASGVFGKEAFSGGLSMAAAGLLFHFIIACSFTALLFIIYPNVNSVLKNKWVIALVYGVFIWLVMNLGVLPLTNAPKSAIRTSSVIKGIIILIVAVGVPISVAAHKHYFGLKR